MTGRVPQPAPRLEVAGIAIGRTLHRALNALGRVVELPADIRARRTGRPARLMRVGCWVCLIFLPVLWWAWLVMLAVAAADRE